MSCLCVDCSSGGVPLIIVGENLDASVTPLFTLFVRGSGQILAMVVSGVTSYVYITYLHTYTHIHMCTVYIVLFTSNYSYTYRTVR